MADFIRRKEMRFLVEDAFVFFDVHTTLEKHDNSIFYQNTYLLMKFCDAEQNALKCKMFSRNRQLKIT